MVRQRRLRYCHRRGVRYHRLYLRQPGTLSPGCRYSPPPLCLLVGSEAVATASRIAHARPRSPTLAHARCTRRAASGEFLERSGDVADGMRVGGAPRWPRRELAAERRAPAVDAAMGAAMSAARRRQLPGGGDFGVGGADGEASREKEIAASLVLSRVTRAMRGSVGSWGHATDLLHAVLPRREPLALRAFGVEGGGCGVRRVLCTSRVGAYHAGLCT